MNVNVIVSMFMILTNGNWRAVLVSPYLYLCFVRPAHGNIIIQPYALIKYLHFRRLHGKIRTLKHLLNSEAEVRSMAKECCSETETQGCGLSDNGSDASNSLRSRGIHKPLNEFTDEFHPVSQIPPSKKSKTNMLQFCGKKTSSSGEVTKASSEDTENQLLIGRKRVRVVLSDDEVDKHDLTDNTSGRLHTKCPVNNKGPASDIVFLHY